MKWLKTKFKPTQWEFCTKMLIKLQQDYSDVKSVGFLQEKKIQDRMEIPVFNTSWLNLALQIQDEVSSLKVKATKTNDT